MIKLAQLEAALSKVKGEVKIKKSSANSFYLQGFIQKCAEAGMDAGQIKQALVDKLINAGRQVGKYFGGLKHQFRAGRDYNKLWGKDTWGKQGPFRPKDLPDVAYGAGHKYDQMLQSPVGQAVGSAAHGVRENMSPLIQWIKQHPIYAGGVGVGTAGAGAGLQAGIGEMGE